MLSLSLVHVLAIVLLFVVAAAITIWLLKKDKEVDLWQEEVAEFAGLLDRWHLPRLADIARSVSAINVTGAIRKIRELRNSIMKSENKDGAMLELLRASFMFQLPLRLKDPKDKQDILEVINKEVPEEE